jgi:hypothetical protein
MITETDTKLQTSRKNRVADQGKYGAEVLNRLMNLIPEER